MKQCLFMKRCLWLMSILVAGGLAFAEQPVTSLVDPFGPKGYFFNREAKKGGVIEGWLPNGWDENSDWAAVNVKYSELSDPPQVDLTAVRMEVTRREDGGAQFHSREIKIQSGVQYLLEGWIRSTNKSSIEVWLRQPDSPYKVYGKDTLDGNDKWERFKVQFTGTGLDEQMAAMIFFIQNKATTVDLAGITFREKDASEKPKLKPVIP